MRTWAVIGERGAQADSWSTIDLTLRHIPRSIEFFTGCLWPANSQLINYISVETRREN